MLIWVIISFVAIAAIGLWAHHIFEGECLPHDLLREWRLSRQSLSDLDQAWVSAPKSDILVTLTTTPSRITLLQPTLKSLLAQDSAPKRIILNVPYHSIREDVAYQVPHELTSLNAVHIERTEDLGPGTKLIPTLARLDDPDQATLVVDDDRIYPAWLVARYAQGTKAQPDSALTLGGWVVPADLEDRFTTIASSLLMQSPAPIRAPRLRQPREIDVMLGVFSYLVKPRFFNLSELQNLDGPPELRYVDDVRTSALCNVAKYVIPARSLSFVPWGQRSSLQATRLGLFNRGNGGGTRHNTIGIQFFKTRWRVGGPKR